MDFPLLVGCLCSSFSCTVTALSKFNSDSPLVFHCDGHDACRLCICHVETVAAAKAYDAGIDGAGIAWHAAIFA